MRYGHNYDTVFPTTGNCDRNAVPGYTRAICLPHHSTSSNTLSAIRASTPPQRATSPPLMMMQLSCPSLSLFLPAPAEIINTRSRFLHARKSDPAKAHKQFAATEAWRRENRVLDLYATFDSDELESAKRFYPRWTGRRDKVSVNLCRVIHVHPIRRAFTAWNTRLRLSFSITDRVPSKRAQCSPRGPPL